MEERTKSIIHHAVLVAFLIGIGVLLTQTLGLGAKGFTDSNVLTQYYFYTIATIAFSVGILALFIASVYTKGDERYGHSLFFFSPGEFPSPNIPILKRTFILLFATLAIFSILFGLLPSITNQQTFFGTGVEYLKQQFTVYGNLSFSNALVPIGENLGVFFFLALTIFAFRYYANKTKMNPKSFQFIALVLVVIVFVLFGGVNHLLRYGDSDISLLSVMVFWGIGGLITAITGSFIPFWMMHLDNNLYLDLTKNFSKTLSFNVSIGVILVSIFFIFLIYFGGKKKI